MKEEDKIEDTIEDTIEDKRWKFEKHIKEFFLEFKKDYDIFNKKYYCMAPVKNLFEDMMIDILDKLFVIDDDYEEHKND